MQDSAARVVVVFATAAYQFGGRFATGLGSVLFPLSVGARAVSGRPYADTPLIPPMEGTTEDIHFQKWNKFMLGNNGSRTYVLLLLAKQPR